ncbi:unnamed protein product [Cuscuta europaea]|uniref:Uncharacterized protein n=1 Tax=Cuscuta europaea TaxID=41803 RepID=A0A9P1E0R2_CUSEU|nr:unnamed protein product [Cuscuta europaea]
MPTYPYLHPYFSSINLFFKNISRLKKNYETQDGLTMDWPNSNSTYGWFKKLKVGLKKLNYRPQNQFRSEVVNCSLMLLSIVVWYLQGTVNHGLWLQSNPDISLIVAYSDADWAGCPDSSRSTTGYVVFLGSNLISWRSKKQPTLSKSSTEAGYRAIAYTVQDTLFIRSLLADMGITISAPVQLRCDNVSASYLVVNHIHHDRSKHIKIDYHFVRERVAHGDLVVKYVPTQLQLADIFTKSLSSQRFEFLRVSLRVVSPAQIEGL